METRINGLNPLTGLQGITERRGGQRPGSGDAFRRALGDDDKEQQLAADGDEQPVAKAPMPRALQPHDPAGRKDRGAPAHRVDVLA
jgi:hypothetical protein